jgi:hypothetical protein
MSCSVRTGLLSITHLTLNAVFSLSESPDLKSIQHSEKEAIISNSTRGDVGPIDSTSIARMARIRSRLLPCLYGYTLG